MGFDTHIWFRFTTVQHRKCLPGLLLLLCSLYYATCVAVLRNVNTVSKLGTRDGIRTRNIHIESVMDYPVVLLVYKLSKLEDTEGFEPSARKLTTCRSNH